MVAVDGVVGMVTGAVGRVVAPGPVGVVGMVTGATVGPTTSLGAIPVDGWAGVGSKETQPRVAPRYTSGQAWASAPRTLVTPPLVWPAVKPTATRVGSPSERAMTAKAPANDSHDPARVTVRNSTSGSVPAGAAGGVRV